LGGAGGGGGEGVVIRSCGKQAMVVTDGGKGRG